MDLCRLLSWKQMKPTGMCSVDLCHENSYFSVCTVLVACRLSHPLAFVYTDVVTTIIFLFIVIIVTNTIFFSSPKNI